MNISVLAIRNKNAEKSVQTMRKYAQEGHYYHPSWGAAPPPAQESPTGGGGGLIFAGLGGAGGYMVGKKLSDGKYNKLMRKEDKTLTGRASKLYGSIFGNKNVGKNIASQASQYVDIKKLIAAGTLIFGAKNLYQGAKGAVTGQAPPKDILGGGAHWLTNAIMKHKKAKGAKKTQTAGKGSTTPWRPPTGGKASMPQHRRGQRLGGKININKANLSANASRALKSKINGNTLRNILRLAGR